MVFARPHVPDIHHIHRQGEWRWLMSSMQRDEMTRPLGMTRIKLGDAFRS